MLVDAPAGEVMVRRVRSELRAATPAGYRWQRHVAMIAAFVVVGLALTLSRLGSVRASDAIWLGAILAFLNFGEYASHRWTMHRRVFPRMVYYRHVVEHHRFFSFDTMAVDGWRDLRWVLFPWWALPLLIASVLPFFLLLHVAVAERMAWLFLLGVVLYYGIYEVLHALAHLPENHRWAGSRWVRRLTYHHRVHHDLRLMHRYNFNFVIPTFDLLFRTVHRDPAGTESTRPVPEIRTD